MKLFQGQVGDFDVSIIVCGEDFSSNLAHKDFRYCTGEFQMIIFVWIQDSLLFHIYCVRGEPCLRLSSAWMSPQLRARCRNSSGLHPSESVFVFISYTTDKHKYYWLWVIIAIKGYDKTDIELIILYDDYY